MNEVTKCDIKREDIIHLALDANLLNYVDLETPRRYFIHADAGVEEIERFASLIAAHERERVAAWMHFNDYTTGHGDCIEDLLEELEWQVAERERWKCAEVAESYEPTCDTCPSGVANAIRSRGET